MILRTFLIILLGSLSAFAGEFPDGLWNSKPWPVDRLEEEAQAGNIDAMAEWAYCSSESMLGIAYDAERIVDYSRKSSQAGSALGTLNLGRAYLRDEALKKDDLKGSELIIQAAETGHPLARYLLGTILSNKDPTGKIIPDFEAALKIFEEPSCKEVYLYDWAQYLIYSMGLKGFKDIDEASTHLKACLQNSSYLLAADTLIYLTSDDQSGYDNYFDDETIRKAWERLEEGVELNNPKAKYRKGLHEYREGNPHIGVPLLIESANTGYNSALYTISFYLRKHYWLQSVGGIGAMGDLKSKMNVASGLYKTVPRYRAFSHIALSHAEALRAKKVEQKQQLSLDDEAIKVYRQVIRDHRNSKTAYYGLAGYIGEMAWREKQGKEFSDHANQIYLYRCVEDEQCAHYLAWGLLDNRVHKYRDNPRGYAAVKYAIERNEGAFKKAEEGYLKRALKRMTPEEITEGEKLIKDGFPYARKYREEAFNFLKEQGDLPEDWVFDDDLDEQEEGTASLSVPLPFLPFMALLSAPPVLEKTTNDAALLLKLMKKEDFLPREHSSLASLLAGDGARLKKAVASLPAPVRTEAEKIISQALERSTQIVLEDNPLQARFFWYLYCSEELHVSALPVIATVAENGLGAKSKLQAGDVIEKVHGVELEGTHARNRFMQLLELWPQGEPLKLDILRAKKNSKLTHNISMRDVKRKITVKFPKD
ncbi:MAG: hypothetical protein Q7Q71_14425 [Verrucomicrobiota bacterium JB023]|nr:hypothetical protein [Verrucomicrobiota bacterium JB023]